MSEAAAAAVRHEIQYIARKHVQRSKTNPRQTFDKKQMEELIASVREHGILQPVLVRPIVGSLNPHPGVPLYELVCGERRHRAAEAAELEELPAVIREMTDEQVVDAQIIENGQRADVHALEEADAYRQKMEKFKRTVDEIAATVGKSKAYVYARLKLCSLVAGPRELFLDGRLNASTALLVARIPSALQDKAAKEIIGSGNAEPLSFRRASEHIQQRYMLRLADAPFSAKDAEIVPAAGSCNDCPKRTGNARELFDDVSGADVCTDPDCYGEKVDAAWSRRTAEASSKGIEVLDDKRAKALWPYEYQHGISGGEFVSLSDICYEDHPKRRTYRQLLKKVQPDAIARNPHSGAIHELLKKGGVGRALKAAGHDFDAQRETARNSTGGGTSKAEQEKWRQQKEKKDRDREVKQRAAAIAMPTLIDGVERTPLGKAFLRMLIDREFDMAGMPDNVLERRGLSEDEDPGKYLDGLSEAKLRGFLFEVVIAEHRLVDFDGKKYSDAFAKACDEHGIDLKAYEKQARELIKQEAKAPKGKKGKAAAGEAGTCKVCGCTETTPCNTGMGPCAWSSMTTQTLCTNPACLEQDLQERQAEKLGAKAAQAKAAPAAKKKPIAKPAAAKPAKKPAKKK